MVRTMHSTLEPDCLVLTSKLYVSLTHYIALGKSFIYPAFVLSSIKCSILQSYNLELLWGLKELVEVKVGI